MKQITVSFDHLLTILLGGIVAFTLMELGTYKPIADIRSRADGAGVVDITYKTNLQGNFGTSQNSEFLSAVTLYSKYGKIVELPGQKLKRESGNIFSGTSTFSNIDLTKFYAIFIKPEKFTGGLYCKSGVSGSACISPQMQLTKGVQTVDFSDRIIQAGDITPQNGKVDAYDLSKTIGDIGKTSSISLDADINSDGIVNSVDYATVLYSLKDEAHDDPMTITFEQSPTSSPTSSSQASPSPSKTPTPTQGISGGRCNTVLNGKITVNAGIFGIHCALVQNEQHHYCVTKESDCNPSMCVSTLKALTNTMLKECVPGGSASINEQQSSITCQTSFIAGSCTDEAKPACKNDRPKCP